jgi:hypothetical protein
MPVAMTSHLMMPPKRERRQQRGEVGLKRELEKESENLLMRYKSIYQS